MLNDNSGVNITFITCIQLTWEQKQECMSHPVLLLILESKTYPYRHIQNTLEVKVLKIGT